MRYRSVFKSKYFVPLALLAGISLTSNTQATEVIVEGGLIWQHRNDVKITPQAGTYLEFNEFDEGPFPHTRLEVKHPISKKSTVRLIYAPFSISVTGGSTESVVFNGETFSANTPLTIDYTFNSYRASYLYRLWDKSGSFFDIGITGKIRQADIQFTQGATSNKYENVGFVPLFHIATQLNIASHLDFYSDFDFAAAPQGQAFDLALKLRYKFSDGFKAGLGLRSLEGGADNDKVFTWSWFNYGVIDFVINF